MCLPTRDRDRGAQCASPAPRRARRRRRRPHPLPSAETPPPKAKQPSTKKPPPSSSSSEADIVSLRAAKADALRAAGADPYAYRFDRTHTAAALQAEHKDLPAGEVAPETVRVSVAGRILARRVLGKLAFIKLADASGDVQLYVEREALDAGPGGDGAFARAKAALDVGDIVGAAGGVRRTEKGELSVAVDALTMLTKALRPLPDKWHGLADVEKRYRQRAVDLIVTPGAREALVARAAMTSAIRRSLESRGFLEVETPVLEAAAGGADARPFTTYHNALGQPFALRIATELHLKRLVVGGFERVFEIGRIFRNEGVSARHNPEFTSVELYQAYADYTDMMDLTEELIREAAIAVTGKAAVDYQGAALDFGAPFRRAPMAVLVEEVTGVRLGPDLSTPATDADRDDAVVALEAAGAGARDVAAARAAPDAGALVSLLFEAAVEPTLVHPTFVLDHPQTVSPLAKPHRSLPGVAERFELFIAGRELANAYSEATDPVDQRAKLMAQVAGHKAAQARAAAAGKTTDGDDDDDDDESYDVELDEDFLAALEQGMPPTGGMGMGLDRLAMLLTDSASIRDVIAFPLLKRKPASGGGGGE